MPARPIPETVDEQPSLVQRAAASGWVLPLVLSLPLIGLARRATAWPWTDKTFGGLMHSSGELAIRLLIVSLLATPLLKIFPKARFTRWLRRRRRVFGVAAFSYGVLHVAFYLTQRSPSLVADLAEATYIAGWVALALMLPLALTSTDGMVSRLGRNWRRLHRAAYFVAVAAAAHWLLKPEESALGPVLVHFLPLAALEANRVRIGLSRSRR